MRRAVRLVTCHARPVALPRIPRPLPPLRSYVSTATEAAHVPEPPLDVLNPPPKPRRRRRTKEEIEAAAAAAEAATPENPETPEAPTRRRRRKKADTAETAEDPTKAHDGPSIAEPEPPTEPTPETTPAAAPASGPLVLRSYQEECIQSVLSHAAAGHHRMAISLATGSGKTVIFTQLISRLTHPHSPTATRTLILAHRRELVQQAYNHCKRTYPDATIEIEMASEEASGEADITIASVQSLGSQRIKKYDPKTFKLILVDECHHAVAPRYLDIFEHFGVLNLEEGGDKDEKPILVGVSATLSRLDGLKLGKAFDYIVYHKDYVDMINEKWLSAVLFTTVKTHADLTKVKSTRGGDFNIEELSKTVNTPALNDVTVRAWAAKAAHRKSTLVFCVDIAHVIAMTETFRGYGIDARYVTSNTPAKDRAALLEAFKAGAFPVLVNCGIYTEGTDIPNIDCVLLARPTQSRNLIVQMIGRGMRLHPGKTNCHIIDMVGSVSQGIVSVPTLLGLDPDEVLSEATLADVKRRQQERAADHSPALPVVHVPLNKMDPKDVEVTFCDYDSVEDLLRDVRLDDYIAAYTKTQLAWVCVSQFPMRYVLSCGGPAIITITRLPDGMFSVTEQRRIPKEVAGFTMKSKPRQIIEECGSFEAAVRGADTYALSKYPWNLLARNAPWRKKPATDGQRQMIAKLIGKEPAEGLTKGSAADMLTKLKCGAKGWLEELKKVGNQEKRRARQEEKLERMRSGGEIRVGKVTT